MSAEVQEWAFVPAKVIRRHGDLPLLSSTGGQRWLNQSETEALQDELVALARSSMSPDDRLNIRRAAALVEYGLDTGTAISVVPPV